MKKIIKNIYVIVNKDFPGKSSEWETLEKAEEMKKFLIQFTNNNNFVIESKQKVIYEIEKGDHVYWVHNEKINYNRIDIVTNIVKDMWGDLRYKTKELNGNKRGIAYPKDLSLVIK